MEPSLKARLERVEAIPAAKHHLAAIRKALAKAEQRVIAHANS